MGCACVCARVNTRAWRAWLSLGPFFGGVETGATAKWRVRNERLRRGEHEDVERIVPRHKATHYTLAPKDDMTLELFLASLKVVADKAIRKWDEQKPRATDRTIESTNALIAALKALDSETRRLERRLSGDDLDDEASEQLGLYATDLQEAAAALGEDYEQRRGEWRPDTVGGIAGPFRAGRPLLTEC